MKKRALTALALILLLYPAAALSHPPAGLMLSYNIDRELLDIEIEHDIGTAKEGTDHYIAAIQIFVTSDGEKGRAGVIELSIQDAYEGVKLQHKVKAKAGDSIMVRAKCSKYGHREATVEVK